LFGEDGSTKRRVADAVIVAGTDAKHVVFLRPVVFHRVRRVPDVSSNFEPVLAGRTSPLDDVVNVRRQSVVRQLPGQPRQPCTNISNFYFSLAHCLKGKRVAGEIIFPKFRAVEIFLP